MKQNSLLEERPGSRTSMSTGPRWGNLDCNGCNGGLTHAEVWRDPARLWVLQLGTPLDFHSEDWRKSSLCSCQRERESHHFEYAQNILFITRTALQWNEWSRFYEECEGELEILCFKVYGLPINQYSVILKRT